MKNQEESGRYVNNEVLANVGALVELALRYDDEWNEWKWEAEADCPDKGEIFEWWIVTEWLAKKLRDRGHIVMHTSNGWIWGRQGTGQAILLDFMSYDFEHDTDVVDCPIINPDDRGYAEECWKVRLTPHDIQFYVWADNEQDAVDELIDWIDEDGGHEGLICRDPEEEEMDEEWLKDHGIQGGNYSYWLVTDGVCNFELQ